MTEKEITAVMVMPSEEFARKSLGNECEIMQPENQFPRQKSMDGDYMYRFVCPQCGETCMIISESELRKYKRTWELLKMVPLLDELIAEFEDLCGRGYRYIGIFCPNEKGDGKFDTVIMNSEDWKKVK